MNSLWRAGEAALLGFQKCNFSIDNLQASLTKAPTTRRTPNLFPQNFMKFIRSICLSTLALIFLSLSVSAQNDQQFADLGDFKLISGQVIRNCKIGYRTFGKLNAEKSNAILFPTWFGGKSADLAGNFGPGKMVDSSKYFIVAVDAIGNGISSSPSNSQDQKGRAFPPFAIRDMVNSQYQLLTQKLGINHLFAVMGISMGGMQTFEWMAAYPDFIERAIPIVGTPWMTSFDLLLWETELKAIEATKNNPNPDEAASDVVTRIHQLALITPSYRVTATKRNEYQDYIGKEAATSRQSFNAVNWEWQLIAMMKHDIFVAPNGPVSKEAREKILKDIGAKMLIIVSRQDQMVRPEPSLEVSVLANTPAVIVDGTCGHLIMNCGAERVLAAVEAFLSK